MADQHRFSSCPDCGASVQPSDVFCGACRLNLFAVEQRIKDDRPTRERDARLDREIEAERREDVQKWTLLASAVIALVLAVVIVLPVGPKLQAADLERSIVSSLAKNGPPSSEKANTEISCVHPLLHTRTFTCRGTVDIALLPDEDVTFKVTVRSDDNNVCWTAYDGDGEPAPRADGCLAK